MITFRRKEQSIADIISTYWTLLTTIWIKTERIWWRRSFLPSEQRKSTRCVVALVKFIELGNKLPPFSPYFPDFFLFTNLKKWSFRKRFGFNNDIIAQTHAFPENLDKCYYLQGVEKLEISWTKCMALKEDNNEKLKLFLCRNMFHWESHLYGSLTRRNWVW